MTAAKLSSTFQNPMLYSVLPKTSPQNSTDHSNGPEFPVNLEHALSFIHRLFKPVLFTPRGARGMD